MKQAIYLSITLGLLGSGAQAQIGVGTSAFTPHSSLDVRGSFSSAIRIFTSSGPLDANDYTTAFTGTTDASVTLPDAVSCIGRTYWIKNASSTLPVPVLTINTVSSQTIEGLSSTLLDEPFEVVRLTSNGANWEITAQDVPSAKSSTIGGAWNQGGNSIKTAKSLGTIANYDFSYITNNTEAMRLTSTGYLGIGSAPSGQIHFSNSNSSEDGDDYIFADHTNGSNSITNGIQLRKSRGSFGSGQNLQDGDTIGQFRFVPRAGGSVNRSGGAGLDAVYKGNGTTALTDLRFFSSDIERLRINENGKVTIDTTAADGANPEKLLVEAGPTTSYNVISGRGSIDNYLQLNIQNTSNTALASSDLVATANNGNESANYIDMGINSQSYNNPAAPILNGVYRPYIYGTGADMVIGNASSGYDLKFFTNGYALTNERMRITAAGNVGIGSTAPGDKLTVAGILAPSVDNTHTLGNTTERWMEVWAANGAIQTSDARLKTNIAPLEYGLDEILKIHPISYNWKTSPDGQHKVGLNAQEIQKLIPEATVGNEAKENLGVNYAELAPALIKAIQQQQKRLEALKAELAEIKNAN